MDVCRLDGISKTSTVTVTCVVEDDSLSPLSTTTLEPALATVSRQYSLDFLWKDARKQFLDGLPSPRRGQEEALVESTTLTDTVQTLTTAKAKAENAYGTRFKGKPVEIKLGRVMHRLEFIMRFGDDATKFAPETVSCVWAAFRLVASAFTHDFESCQFLVDAVDQISDILFVCEVHAKQELSRSTGCADEPYSTSHKVLERIPPLLALVLRFAYETRRLFVEKGRFSRAFSILFGGAQELKDIFSDAEAKRDELNQVAGIAFHEAVVQLLQAAQQDTQTIVKYLKDLELSKEEIIKSLEEIGQTTGEVADNVREISDNVRELMRVQLKEGQAREREDLDAKLREHLTQLQVEGIAPLHEPDKVLRLNLDRRHPKTCEWITADERFSAWLEPRETGSSSNLLWLSGAAGFGKSVLMSYVMDTVMRRELVARNKPLVLRFFCKLGNDATQKGAKVITHLLSQLLHVALLENTPFQVKHRCVEVAKGLKDGSHFHETKIGLERTSLLFDLARAFGKPVCILIDALDECEDRNAGLLRSLVQIATSTSLDLRLMVSSRPERDIHDAFTQYGPTRIYVDKKSSEKDVEAYIAESLKAIRRFDQPKRTRAAARIAEKAAGMFRYATLAVEGMKSPAALRKPFRQLLDDLPDGLANLYEQELRALEPAIREILLVALRWVICGEGPITVDFVADELEGSYLHHDSDLEPDEDALPTAIKRLSTSLETVSLGPKQIQHGMRTFRRGMPSHI